MTRKPQDIENLLLRMVINHELSEQSQIQEKLLEAGVDIPQSTLSRWLKKLNIIKINHRYQVFDQSALTRIPVFSIKFSLPNLIVLQTLPGNANALAYQIDQKMSKMEASKEDPYFGVLGTIAGDDTVLIIMQDEQALLNLKARLEQNKDTFYILHD